MHKIIMDLLHPKSKKVRTYWQDSTMHNTFNLQNATFFHFSYGIIRYNWIIFVYCMHI